MTLVKGSKVSNELVNIERSIIRAKRNLARIEQKKRRVTIQQWFDEFDSFWEQSKTELEDLITLRAFIQLTK
jgi:hypothetical protein